MFVVRVSKLLEDKGVSKNKLLKDIELGSSSFRNWETQGKTPSSEAVSKIADYFNVSTDFLLGLTDDPTPRNATQAAPGNRERLDDESELFGQRYANLSPEKQAAIRDYLDFLETKDRT